MIKYIAPLMLFILQPSYSGDAIGHSAGGVGLTDEEQAITQEYVHEGLREDAKNDFREEQIQSYMDQYGWDRERAEQEIDGVIAGDEGDVMAGTALEGFPIDMLAQAYSMIVGVIPGKMTLGVKYTAENVDALKGESAAASEKAAQLTTERDAMNPTDTEVIAAKQEEINQQTTLATDKGKEAADIESEMADGKEKKEVEDYCKYIATVGETIAAFKQQADQEDIVDASTDENDQQVEALYAAKRSHESSAETAKIQTAVWGSTAGCYVIYLGAAAFGGGATGGTWAQIIFKLAASGIFTAYYAKAIEVHTNRANMVQSLIDSFPEKGTCNPVSQRNCYCSQESTKNDATYCYSKMHQRALNNAIRTTCIDQNMKEDPQCNCAASGTCYDKTYMNMLQISGLGQEFTQSSYDAMKALTTGSVSYARVDGSLSDSSAAKRRDLLRKYDGKFASDANLDKSQKKTYDALTKLGVPANISRRFASASSSSATKQYGSRFTGNNAARKYTYTPTSRASNVTYFGGKGAAGSKSSGSSVAMNSTSAKLAALRAKLQGQGGEASGSNVMMFAEKAATQSQISKTPERSIFEIISRRYQVSGAKALSE